MIPFNDSITYTCKSGFFFEDDIERTNYTVMCHEDGSLTQTRQMICVDPKGE